MSRESEMTPIEEANEGMMKRYREAVSIELSRSGIWVTLNGQHYRNDPEKLDEALRQISSARDF